MNKKKFTESSVHAVFAENNRKLKITVIKVEKYVTLLLRQVIFILKPRLISQLKISS